MLGKKEVPVIIEMNDALVQYRKFTKPTVQFIRPDGSDLYVFGRYRDGTFTFYHWIPNAQRGDPAESYRTIQIKTAYNTLLIRGGIFTGEKGLDKLTGAVLDDQDHNVEFIDTYDNDGFPALVVEDRSAIRRFDNLKPIDQVFDPLCLMDDDMPYGSRRHHGGYDLKIECTGIGSGDEVVTGLVGGVMIMADRVSVKYRTLEHEHIGTAPGAVGRTVYIARSDLNLATTFMMTAAVDLQTLYDDLRISKAMRPYLTNKITAVFRVAPKDNRPPILKDHNRCRSNAFIYV